MHLSKNYGGSTSVERRSRGRQEFRKMLSPNKRATDKNTEKDTGTINIDVRQRKRHNVKIKQL